MRAACAFPASRPRFITILASFAYALFTGFATPVQRSLWMVTLYLLGRLVYRERSPLNTIGFAALCLLAVSPRSLFDASLQMTLLAVIAIAGVAAPLLQGTIQPYLTATRDLRLTAIDAKLSPLLAQFRVTLRMVAPALGTADEAIPGEDKMHPKLALSYAILQMPVQAWQMQPMRILPAASSGRHSMDGAFSALGSRAGGRSPAWWNWPWPCPWPSTSTASPSLPCP